MSATAKFPLELIIKAVDRATSVLKRVNDRIEKLTEPVRRVNNAFAAMAKDGGLGRLNKALGDVSTRLGHVHNQVRGLGVGLAVSLGVAGYSFNEFLINPAAEFEKQQAMMLTAAKGNAALAASNMEWVRKFAIETPLTLNETIDSFIRLKNWGIDPMNGSLRSMVEQMSAMGGNKDMLDGIILAFGQSFTAGKLQGQDIGQLTTRGVPVWDILSETMKKPIAQLRKLSEAGKIGRKEIEGLVMAMGARNAGAMDRLMRTWNGILSRLSDFKDFIAIQIMAAGPFDFLKGKLEGLLATLQKMKDNGSLDKWTTDIGAKIVKAFEAIWEAAPKVWDAIQGLFKLFMAFAGTVGGVTNALIILGGAYVFGPLLVSLAALTVSVAALGAAMTGPLVAGIYMAVRAVAALSSVLLAVPGGWVIVALLGIAMAAQAIYDNWEPIKAWWASFWTSISTLFEATWRGMLAFLGGLGQKIGEALYSALTFAFNLARSAVPQWFIDLTGGAFQLGSDIGTGLSKEIGSWFGPAAPAAAAKPAAQRASIDVRFQNAPRNMRATGKSSGFTEFRLDTGYAMGEAR